MTKFILPRMLERKSRSAIIDVSSIGHYNPGAKMAVYCATKSYNYMFSANIAKSYPDKIDVLTVTPGGTRSQLYSGRYTFSVTAESHGKAVIDQLGWQSVTYGSYVHAIEPLMRSTPL
jgi:short-subunit dehydrogenase